MGFMSAMRSRLAGGLAKPAVAPQSPSVQGGLDAAAGTMQPATAPISPLPSVLGSEQPVAQPLANTNTRTITPTPSAGPYGGAAGSPFGIANPRPVNSAMPIKPGFAGFAGRLRSR